MLDPFHELIEPRGGERLEGGGVSGEFAEKIQIGRKGSDCVDAAPFGAQVIQEGRDSLTQGTVASEGMFTGTREQRQLLGRHRL